MPAIYEPTLQERPAEPARDLEADNLAIVRMWWTVLESEWRQALAERDSDTPDRAIVDAGVREALAPFEEFDAAIEELLACDDHVVMALELRGRIVGRPVAIREAWRCRLVEGSVVEVRDYPTLEQAVASIPVGAGASRSL